MDLQHLSTHGLLMLYQAVKLALDEDDEHPHDRLFQVRENADWREWSDQIANELDVHPSTVGRWLSADEPEVTESDVHLPTNTESAEEQS